MLKTKLTSFLCASVIVTALGFTSCNKDDGDIVTPASNTEVLTRAAWNGEFLVYDTDTTYEDFVSQMHFKVDGTVDIYDEDNTGFDTYNWLFINNESQIVLDSDTANLIVLTEKKLIISMVDEGADKLEFHLNR